MRTVFILLFFSSAVFAQTTYYVNNVIGSDSSNGLTSNTPKKNISSTIAIASPGDIISVAATNQIYTDSIIISKPLTLASTNGKPQLSYFKANISGFSSNQVTFMARFSLQTLVLSAGKVQGSDSITITANGKIVRSSDSAQVLQRLKFAGQVDLEYKGSTNITMGYEVPAADSTIKNLTLNFDSSAATPNLFLSRNLFVYNVNFINGLLITGPYYIHLDNPLGKASNGYIRNVQPGYKSHVVGNVRKTLRAGTIIPFGRNEFPVGDVLFYRPMVLTFMDSTGNRSLGINVIASETNQRPTGIVGLPIANGVSQGVDIARYPNFYWSMKADSTYDKEYTLELTAQDFTDYDDITNVRIIRRRGTIIDITNPWTHSGTYNDNFIIAGIPTVVNINQTGGITKDGNIFTYGVKSRLFLANPFPNFYFTYFGQVIKKSLTNPPAFMGNQGPLKFEVRVSIPGGISAEIIGDTLLLTLRYSAAGIVTITATDIDSTKAYYSFQVGTLADCFGPPNLPAYSSKNIFFGNVKIGESKDTTLKIVEYGCYGFSIPQIVSTNQNFKRLRTTGYPHAFLFTDTIRFSPSSAGTISGNLLVYTDAGTSPDTIKLSGIGDRATSVEKFSNIPSTFSLSQNYPNPFNPTTAIEFELPQPQFVKLTIYNMLGEEIETLANARFLPGRYKVNWNASNFHTGVYFYRLQAGNFVETKKLILLK